MEPITAATIGASFLTGAVIGFISMGTGNLKIKAGIDIAGAAALYFFLIAIMPTIALGTPIDEATQQVTDFTFTTVYALIAYLFADAFGSLGYMAVTGSRG